MPWLFLLFIVFGLIAILLALFHRHPDEGVKAAAGVAQVAVAVLALLALLLSSLTIVSTRNVGVMTEFGRPVGTLPNGIHLKLPWQKKHELDGTIQTNWKRGGFGDDGKCSGGTTVRLANNAGACVDNSVRWRIIPTAADALYRDYRDDANIRDSLVTRALEASLAEVFSRYDPLAPEVASGPNLAELAMRATTKLRQRTAEQIEVLEIIIAVVHFDGGTQRKIDAYQAQLQDTRIAGERQHTALAEAEANRRLADSITRDPNVLVSKCLDMINAGKQLPTGFQCWPAPGLPVSIPAR